MFAPLATLDAKLKSTLPTMTVAAPRARLAREIRYAHDVAMAENGKSGWRTADVLPIDALIARRYEELADASWAGAERTLLSRDAFRVAAAQAAPNEDLARHVELFMTAWGLAHEWRLFDHASELQRSENGRAFVDWSRRFERRCRDNGWITTPELPAILTRAAQERADPPRPLALVGAFSRGARGGNPSQVRAFSRGARGGNPSQVRAFSRGARGETPRKIVEQPSTARRSWFEALAAAGAEVRELPLPSAQRSAVPRVAQAGTASEELAVAAAWARETLARNRDAAVAIVVPTLHRMVGRLRTQFQAAFDDFVDIEGMVNFGGGGRLAGEDVCRDALRLIEWTLRPLHFEAVAALLRSRHVRLTANARAPLPSFLPTFFDLIRYAGAAHPLAKLARSAPTNDLPSAWGRHFRRLLRESGWHDIDLERRAHQARVQTDALLLGLGEQDAIVGRCSGAAAFGIVKMIAAARTFAERSPNAPIQVLSREDSVGLTFDSMWVLGADDLSWPGPSQPNPLIPTQLQRDAGIPRTSGADELDWARITTEGWLGNANEVTFSYAETDGDAERRPSRLLPELRPIDARAALRDPLLAKYRHPYMRRGQVRLESHDDECGAKLETPAVVDGGVSILRDQSICPFRGYAIHRLDLSEGRMPHSLPDALDRGALAHEAVARLVADCGPASELLALSGDDLRAVAEHAITAHGARWPQVFREREAERLASLLAEWLKIEQNRPGFEVLAVESATSIELDGVGIRLRPDRRDRMRDGQVVVIDFKTSPASVMDWRPPRPREPQVPLYAMAAPNTDAAAFAQLAPDTVRFVGVADDVPGFMPPNRLGADDFATLKAGWRDALLALAREYRNGLATVAPQRPADCRNCHLHSLCRVFEST